MSLKTGSAGASELTPKGTGRHCASEKGFIHWLTSARHVRILITFNSLSLSRLYKR